MRETFGQYELLQRFAVGGMAEVFMARRLGAGGFSREVVIKRMLAHLAGDDEYVRMFFDEARLTATLQHPNIAQVLDLGWLDGTWFIAMEFVDGPDLSALMIHTVRAKLQMPLGLAAWIAARAGEGLHFAHEQRDPMTGESMAIVHRDVSLSNILLSRFGDVKVADFGIARAAMRESVITQVGKVKGKPGYLAPEQIRGEPFDRRADVFALGVVLWEMIAGKRLFVGRSDFDTLEMTVDTDAVAPSELRPEVNPALDALVLGALRRDPALRTATAGEVTAGLDGWLRDHGDGHGSRGGLVRWLDEQAPQLWPPARRKQEAASLTPALAPGAVPASEAPTRLTADPAAAMQGSVTPVRKNNLVDNTDRFIGRGVELAHIEALLADRARLISLMGVAGVGKSRLAAEVARRQIDGYDAGGGLWRCALAEAGSLDDAISAVAKVLDVRLGGAASADTAARQLGDAMSGRGPMLLLLDDADEVGAALGPVLSGWLAQAPDLAILRTARSALQVQEERVHEVLPLAFPPPGAEEQAALASEAVQLLLDRSGYVTKSGNEGKDEAHTLAALARRLDGLPLALELAAAQMATLAPAELLQRLSRRFDVLEPPARRGRRGRRQTLRGAIDWSWHMLQPEERDVLTQATVFRGGFSLAAAEQVLQVPAGGPAVGQIVGALRDRAMLRAMPPGPDGEARYGLYESIRGYVRQSTDVALAEGVAPPAEAQQRRLAGARQRLLAWALASGAELRKRAAGHDAVAALARLAAETDNLLATYELTLIEKNADAALRLAGVLFPLFIERGPLGVLGRLYDAALALADGDDAAEVRVLARALTERAEVRVRCGQLLAAQEDAEQALALAQEAQDDALQALSWLQVGACLRRADRMTDAMRALVEARQFAASAGEVAIEAEASHLFGCVYYDVGEHEPARRCFEAGLAAARQRGDRHLAARARANIGCIHADRGELDAAEDAFVEALRDEQELGNRRGQAITRCYLGLLAQERGHSESAQGHFSGAIAMLVEVGDHFRRAYVEGFLAWNHLEQGQHDDAWTLLEPTVTFFLDCGDRRLRAMFLASLGHLAALRDDEEAGKEMLERAERIGQATIDPVVHTVVELFGAATKAVEASKMPARQRLRAQTRIRRLVDKARAPRPPDKGKREQRPPLARLSSEVRFAIRLVERFLS